MNTLLWVLAGLLVFWIGLLALRARGALPSHVRVFGPIATLETQSGKSVIDRLASPTRLWRAWANVGLGIALVVMVGSLLFFIFSTIATLRQPQIRGSQLREPQNLIVVPGLNDFLPLSVAPEIVFGLGIGLIVHEGGHAILCRVEDIDIEKFGLLFLTIVPAGAFVEPNQDSQESANRGPKARMFAAGVTNNFAITIVALLLLFGPVVGALSVVSGATVAGSVAGTPASDAGIERGDVIVSLENESVESNEDIQAALQKAETNVTVELKSGDEFEIQRAVTIARNSSGSVETAVNTLPAGEQIVAVNNTTVSTEADFQAALNNRTVVQLETDSGETVTGPAGLAVTVIPSEPLAEAGAPTDTTQVLTRLNGTRIVGYEEMVAVLNNTSAGQTVTAELYDGQERASYNVTLGADANGDSGFLGVRPHVGVSGLIVTDFGTQYYPAGNYLGALGGDCAQCSAFGSSTAETVYFTVTAPVIGVLGSTAYPYNFAGFTGALTNFYTVKGPLSVVGGGIFALANILFWTAWININLAFFNCIPTFALDGGKLLSAGVRSVFARLPIDDRMRVADAATMSIQLVMLATLLLLLLGPQLL